MTNEQTGMYLLARSISALIEAMGMFAENQLRAARGETLAYDAEAFYNLLEEYAIKQNDG